MATISLLGAEWEPVLPDSFTERQEIVLCFNRKRPHRAYGAALGLTWAHPKVRLRFSYADCGYDPMLYGQMVFDFLASKKIPVEKIADAGSDAFLMVAQSIISQDEVEDRAAFSEASGEESANPDANLGAASGK